MPSRACTIVGKVKACLKHLLSVSRSKVQEVIFSKFQWFDFPESQLYKPAAKSFHFCSSLIRFDTMVLVPLELDTKHSLNAKGGIYSNLVNFCRFWKGFVQNNGVQY